MKFEEYLDLRNKAYALVKKKSGDEMRYHSPIKNQPYWTHLMNVHNFLIIKGEQDYEVLIASLLHDLLEDSDVTKDYISKHFSKRISDIVEIVTKRDISDLDSFYKNILKQVDHASLKIKVADRIDNILTNYCHSEEAQSSSKNIIETKKYFLPMARKIGWTADLQLAMKYFLKHTRI